jgi:diguanylate cyclase (GGDEF)-like protein/putative nucleotidyltransferase with HDIG domain
MRQRPVAARAYAGGALAAVVAALAAAALSVPVLWLAPLIAVASCLLYLGHLRRIEDERLNTRQMSELHLATLQALAMAIDARDRTTPNHILRVQAYATGLARAMGMSEAEVRGIETGALLRDIGKLAIPEHILTKPGLLNPEEFSKIRVHPEVGAGIIRTVPFPYPVAAFILSHHERWDGRGYPAGLKADDIPLGARVICIADYFNALTSDRPYRAAVSTEAAVAVLRQESGKALDPAVVDAFVNALPQLMAAIEPVEPANPKLMRQLQTGEGLRTLGTRPSKDDEASVFDDISLAHREIYGLYQIAEAMGTKLGLSDMMSLVSSRLSNLVPFSACALFLYSGSTDRLHCRFAIGTDSELMRRLVLPSGQGLNGWVARHRRPLVNAKPSADLESIGVDTPTVLQSALACPLTLDQRVIGTLALYHTESSFYREDHLRLLERVCEQAAAVIHNSVIFEKTQEDSLTDTLTGLPNTRSLYQYLTRELARASRLQIDVSLIVMDLNDFKSINDTYGHQAGDAALREVSAVLRGAIRPYDMCVRYAGDEFVVVLTDCSRGQAEIKRAELEAAVGNIALAIPPGDPLMTLSLCAGAAVFPYDGETYEALLAAADGRMYTNKRVRKAEAAGRVVSDDATDMVDGTATE